MECECVSVECVSVNMRECVSVSESGSDIAILIGENKRGDKVKPCNVCLPVNLRGTRTPHLLSECIESLLNLFLSSSKNKIRWGKNRNRVTKKKTEERNNKMFFLNNKKIGHRFKF